jgi:hypothetical protein
VGVHGVALRGEIGGIGAMELHVAAQR